ncbi:hypothetical protein VT03_01140 [Planctomyces sp. SH-PL14]|nr:hypothetical protein VT03_01140 [Planctomyces sp. SH-PL14]
MKSRAFGPSWPSGVLRMLTSEYAALGRVAASPLAMSELTASAPRDVHFLLGWRLATVGDGQVMLSERDLLSTEPLTSTEKTIGFDASALG